MKIFNACLVLLTAGVCGVAAKAVHTISVDSNGGGRILTPQRIYGGWINPEDLTPMPQCIAQQDQSTWLSTMTKCTGKRCTSHFGVICNHHQWLTQLSCLSTEFSPDVIKGYLPYCSRSILAKAQLYLWVYEITGRTWLVDVGDANGLQNLSPASLTEGYTAVNVIYNAPTCLRRSVSALSMEPFQHVMASCSFTSTTQHTGNAARPWEYNERLRSMTALDSETVGYNLARGSIIYGDYFDKECFCGTFTIDLKNDPCSVPGQPDLTKEWLWINATCGPKYVPDNWTDMLKTTEFAYIPIEDWRWPTCVADMPKQVIGLTDQCATDACEIDSNGYCKVRHAVDRACFCRDISYDSCGGSCHIFETRINYVKWLHDLCSDVPDWHGLPDNWRQLAAPTPLDMIPWRWTLKPFNGSNITPITRLGPIKATETCASNEWKLRSLAWINIATLIAALLSQTTGIHRIARGFLGHPPPCYWFLTGLLIFALQFLATWFNASLVQGTFGYEEAPVTQLVLLWCSIPRLTWVPMSLLRVQPFEAMNFSAAASSLVAEIIIQSLSSYYMVMTVIYGFEHNLFFRSMEGVERAGPANVMYMGALLWFILILIYLTQLIRAATLRNRALEKTPLMGSEGGNYTLYGTFPEGRQTNSVSQKAFMNLYEAMAGRIILLWIAQWLFWGGFIFLSSEEFCPPKLVALTTVWIVFSSASAIVGAT